jgi:hypothetical protein
MFQAFHLAVLERVSGTTLGFPLDWSLDKSEDSPSLTNETRIQGFGDRTA